LAHAIFEKERNMTEVNDTLPDVTVADSAGNAVNLAGLQGPFVLYFYPKADTPGSPATFPRWVALFTACRKTSPPSLPNLPRNMR
jgi:peroxiredoxin